MAKDQNLVSRTPRRQGAPLAVAPAPAVANRRVGPVQFLREVRAEARKVTWTTWRETWITSVMVGIMVVLTMIPTITEVMVGIMVVLTAVFFFGVDEILHVGMGAILKLANAE